MSMEHLTSVLATPGLPVCDSPIFIIGCPRSGTTALSRALARHSGLWTSHESYFLHNLFGHGRATDTFERQRNRSAPGWLKTEEVEREEFLGFLGLGMNALYTSRSGGRRWVEQTPLYTTMVDDLAALFPGAVFLHIRRDGRRVVHSMSNFLNKFADRPHAVKHVPGWATDFAEACRTWRDWVSTSSEFGSRQPARYHLVVNEELLADPDRVLRSLLDFLGEQHEDGPAAFLREERVNSSFGPTGEAREEPWDAWDAERRETFAEIAGPAMVTEGIMTTSELRRWADSPASAPAMS
jgi:hypothetical protein